MHAELQWALFGILITHVHDSKSCVMMESIKNVAVSDLVPLFLLPKQKHRMSDHKLKWPIKMSQQNYTHIFVKSLCTEHVLPSKNQALCCKLHLLIYNVF